MTETIKILTPICHEQVDSPMAWSGAEVGKERFVHRFSPKNVAALEELFLRTRHLDREQITRDMCAHPDLDDVLQEAYRDVMFGQGLIVLAGFPVQNRPLDEVERIYWIAMNHFGVRMLQHNSMGHTMVKVQQEILPEGVQPARGTKSNAELGFHNDSSDILGLLCVHEPISGGASQFTSGVAAHNTILAEHPEILPILYRGFPHHRRTEQWDDQPDITPYDVPVFSTNTRGEISIHWGYSSIAPSMAILGRTLSPEEERAIAILREVLDRQQIEFQICAGEAFIANNFAMCHARSDYVDSPEPTKRRLLLRAWTEVPDEHRRLPKGREFFHMENRDGRLGYDKVPGRDERLATNEYQGMSPEVAAMIRAAQAKPKFAGRG
jgi:hypothetical protein